jgi:hypothetical protein
MADARHHRSARGKATFAYDWMRKPDWPTTEGEFYEPLYLDDLQRFPRTPENIPEWYPVDLDA